MADSVALLSLPAESFDSVSKPAIRDAISYFQPDIVTIPGSTNPEGYASVRDLRNELPTDHPQLAQRGKRIHHYQGTPSEGVQATDEAKPTTTGQDIISVQNQNILERVTAQLADGNLQTEPETATYLIVPRLAVEWDTTTLTTILPKVQTLGKISTTVPEPVTVLAGGMPPNYHHEWSVEVDGESVSVSVVGLGASDQGSANIAKYTLTEAGTAAPEIVKADKFGLQALHGVGSKTADRLRNRGVNQTESVRDIPASELASIPGVGSNTAEKIHAHADVIESGEPLVLTNKTPVKTRTDQPPLCLDIETDGLSPTIIWQFGVYDPATDTHRAFIEKNDPNNPSRVLEDFMNWLLANHSNRTILTWNGYDFDYEQIRRFLKQHLPGYLSAWDDLWTYDLYKWAVRDGNALLPGRTNQLDHVARALGFKSAETGLTGAQTAAAYQEFMRNPNEPDHEPDWERHRQYCEDDCRALWHVYQSITEATRRDMTDSGTGGATGQQAGLTDF
jgi:uncharacterized protein YprB with RNaseH-like and TPR domain